MMASPRSRPLFGSHKTDSALPPFKRVLYTPTQRPYSVGARPFLSTISFGFPMFVAVHTYSETLLGVSARPSLSTISFGFPEFAVHTYSETLLGIGARPSLSTISFGFP